MTKPSEDHAQLLSDPFAPLNAAMGEADCRASARSPSVRRSVARGGDGMAVIPDIVVLCGPCHGRNSVTDPLVDVEAPSRSTLRIDRGAGFDVHRSPTSVQHMILIHRRQICVERFRRAALGWPLFESVRPTDRLDLAAIGVPVALNETHFEDPELGATGLAGDPSDDRPALPIRRVRRAADRPKGASSRLAYTSAASQQAGGRLEHDDRRNGRDDTRPRGHNTRPRGPGCGPGRD